MQLTFDAFKSLVGFHLFQRVVGFRRTTSRDLFNALNPSFHLFQRVVGFRLWLIPAVRGWATESFHLFQRVVGFRPEEGSFVKEQICKFPSLSESSGFPTMTL